MAGTESITPNRRLMRSVFGALFAFLAAACVRTSSRVPACRGSLGLDVEALRSLDTGITSLRRLAGPALGASVPLGLPGLSAETDAALFVVRGTANDASIRSAVRIEVGMRYTFARVPLDLSLSFRRQTFTFASPRSPESLGGLVISARARLRRFSTAVSTGGE